MCTVTPSPLLSWITRQWHVVQDAAMLDRPIPQHSPRPPSRSGITRCRIPADLVARLYLLFRPRGRSVYWRSQERLHAHPLRSRLLWLWYVLTIPPYSFLVACSLFSRKVLCQHPPRYPILPRGRLCRARPDHANPRDPPGCRRRVCR